MKSSAKKGTYINLEDFRDRSKAWKCFSLNFAAILEIKQREDVNKKRQRVQDNEADTWIEEKDFR